MAEIAWPLILLHCDFKGIPDYMDQDANEDRILDEEDRDTDKDGTLGF